MCHECNHNNNAIFNHTPKDVVHPLFDKCTHEYCRSPNIWIEHPIIYVTTPPPLKLSVVLTIDLHVTVLEQNILEGM